MRVVQSAANVTAAITDQAFNRLVVSIACAVYLVGYAGYSFGHSLSSLRYVTYAVPAILVAGLSLQRNSTWNEGATVFFLAYLSLAPLGYLVGVKETDFFFNNFIIMLLIIVSFVPKIDVGIKHIRVVFLCSLAYLVFAYALTEHGGVRLFQMLKSGTGSGVEDGFDNHEGGLVGPIYAVFFYAVGAKIQFLLALVMSILGGKRIAIIAILVGLACLFLFRKAAVLKTRRNRLVFLLATLGVINIAASNMIRISQYVHESLRMSVSIEEIMLGRHAIGYEMTRAIDDRSQLESLVGFGPGAAAALATRVSTGTLKEPHNDWLKILYDYGIMGSVAITVFIALVFSTSATAAVVAIASAILMTTDNVVMYLYYQFPIVLMVGYCAPSESRMNGTAQPASR
jgi:hypothetical protein